MDEHTLSDRSARAGILPRLHSDYAIAALIVAFSGLVYGLTLGFDGVPASIAGGMAPETFPRLCAGVLAVLAAVLALGARDRPDPPREPVPAIVPWTALTMLAFMGAMALVGFVGAAILLVVGMGRLWGERRWWLLGLSAAGLALGIRAMFVNGFGIPLPGGLLAGLMG